MTTVAGPACVTCGGTASLWVAVRRGGPERWFCSAACQIAAIEHGDGPGVAKAGDAGEGEASFQERVVALGKTLGWMVYHTFDSRRSEKGFPDLVLVHRYQGRVIFAELKAAKGHMTREQEAWMEALVLAEVRSNGVVERHLWRPADWERLERILRGVGPLKERANG